MNARNSVSFDECAEQRFETADGDNKRCALIDIGLAMPVHVSDYPEQVFFNV